MLLPVVMIAAGLVALFYGAEWLVKGSARLAGSFGVPSLVIGLTLVAFSTSAPELLVSLTAALQGSNDISVGNVVGSNIANVGLILGMTGLVFPIAVHSQVLRREIPLMLFFSLLTYLFVLDGELSTWDGLLLFICLVVFNLLSYILAEKAEALGDSAVEEYEEAEELLDGDQVNRLLELGRVAVGVCLLLVGANWLVGGASTIARALGISELVIGLSLVAFGTSLPELATSLVSAYRDEDDISVGNIVGSNIFNLLAVLGITSLVRPITVSSSLIRFEFPIMIAFSFILWPLLSDGKLSRWQGMLLFGGYAVFLVNLFLA